MLAEDLVVVVVTLAVLAWIFLRYDRKARKGERSWDDLKKRL